MDSAVIMSYMGVLMPILNISLLVHAVVTRQRLVWIIFLGAGVFLGWALTPLFYVIFVILPSINIHNVRSSKQKTQQFIQNNLETIKPLDVRIQEAEEAVQQSDTLEHRVKWVNLLSQSQRIPEAKEALAPLLTGIYAQDALVLLCSAELDMAQGTPAEAENSLQEIDLATHMNMRGRVLTLKALAQAAQNKEEADQTFQEAIQHARGEETKLRYATYLFDQGREDAARTQVEQLITAEQQSSPFYVQQEREWFEKARELYQRLHVKT